jgi:hypothetical protein
MGKKEKTLTKGKGNNIIIPNDPHNIHHIHQDKIHAFLLFRIRILYKLSLAGCGKR